MINEILFLSIMLISFIVVLFSFKLGKTWVMLIPPLLLVLANIFASQVIYIFGIPSTLALPLYAAIFLSTDIISEHWGKKKALKVIWMGFAAQILLLIISQLILLANVSNMSIQLNEALKIVFGFTPRIVFGSLIAYVISQNWDVWLFYKLKKKTHNKQIWLRNNASTISSQLIDSSIFITIAFYGIVPNILIFIISAWLLKILVALLDTPFIYLSYKMLGKKKL